MPLILAQRRQRQVDLKFEASLVYRENCRTVKATQKNLFQINKPNQKLYMHIYVV